MFDNFWVKLQNVFGYGDLILVGLKNTVIIAVMALLIGIVLGTLAAISLVIPKKNIFTKIWGWFSNLYITIIRGTPLVVQLLLMYFGILASLRIDALIVAIMVFGINSGAYVCEIMRSGILAVDNGQMEAGRSLGFTYAQTMFRIVLPQAVKNILPTLGNEFISLLKETSVAGFITVKELSKVGEGIVAGTYDAFTAYLVIAVIYLVIVVFLTYMLKLFERRLRKGDQR